MLCTFFSGLSACGEDSCVQTQGLWEGCEFACQFPLKKILSMYHAGCSQPVSSHTTAGSSTAKLLSSKCHFSGASPWTWKWCWPEERIFAVYFCLIFTFSFDIHFLFCFARWCTASLASRPTEHSGLLEPGRFAAGVRFVRGSGRVFASVH